MAYARLYLFTVQIRSPMTHSLQKSKCFFFMHCILGFSWLHLFTKSCPLLRVLTHMPMILAFVQNHSLCGLLYACWLLMHFDYWCSVILRLSINDDQACFRLYFLFKVVLYKNPAQQIFSQQRRDPTMTWHSSLLSLLWLLKIIL